MTPMCMPRRSEAGREELVGGARVGLDDRAGAQAEPQPVRRDGAVDADRPPSFPSQIRSSGKRIVNVCTERQRGMCSA